MSEVIVVHVAGREDEEFVAPLSANEVLAAVAPAGMAGYSLRPKGQAKRYMGKHEVPAGEYDLVSPQQAVPPAPQGTHFAFAALQLAETVGFSARSHEDVLRSVGEWIASPSFPPALGAIVKDRTARTSPNYRAASFLETTSRNETFCALASNFIRGYCRDASPEAGVYDGRMVLPLCATAGAPGTGKSRLLDDVWRQLPEYLADGNRVPQLDSEDLQRVAELRDLLGHCIPLLVTYNGWSMASGRDAEMPTQYLALRILATYFFKFGPSAGFGDAYDQFARWASQSSSFGMLSLTMALDAIKLDNVGSGIRAFYLGADELAKLLDVDPPGNALKSVLHTITEASECRMHSEQWKLLHVVTSLSVSQLLTSSGRAIDWIPLKLLKSESAVRLLTKKYPRLANLQVFEVSIRDCGGHPRSLERLCIVLDRLMSRFSDVEDLGRVLTLDYIYAEMEAEVRRESTGFPLLNVDILRPVLQATAHSLGYLEANRIVPVIPPFMLRVWAKDVIENAASLPAEKRALTLQVALTLSKFLITGLQWPEGSPAGGHFELFHGGWELLRHLLATEKRTTIDEHYKGLAVWKDDSSQLKRREVSYSTSEPCLVKTLAPDWDKGKEESGCADTFTEAGIYVPPAWQEGLDLITVFKTQKSFVATAVENRFTAEGKDNSTTAVDIDHKGKLFNDIKASKALPVLSLLVFVSYRDMAKSILEGKTWSHNNVIVIPKERLRELYGPTLGNRLQFMQSTGKALPPTGSLQCAVTEMSAKYGM
eukprot:m51a1_g213 hypothetical protein (767) ;mRNA; r:25219-28125